MPELAYGFAVPTLQFFNTTQIEEALKLGEADLMAENRRIPIALTRDWAKRFPADAGVYAIYDDEQLIYVGETGRLKSRMGDWLDTRNHVLRRSIGNRLFKDEPGFSRASVHQRFTNEIETKLIDYIESRLSVAVIIVPLGRAELEEHMTAKHRPVYNAKGKRGTKLHERT